MTYFPEIILLTVACFIPVADIIHPSLRRINIYALTQGSLIVAAIGVILFASSDRQLLLSDIYVSDSLSDGARFFIFLSSALAIFHAKKYLELHNLFSSEYQTLTLFAVLGMSILTTAHNFFAIYVGLELLSLSLYALSAIHKNSSVVIEAAIKYFIFGALASGVLLYGISILYGITGTLDLAKIGAELSQSSDKSLLLAVIFVVVGILFKFGAVPLHGWVPDIYQGTPTAIPQLIGSAPKIASLVMTIRIFGESLAPLLPKWQLVLIASVVISLALGNLVALAQISFKRMLGYSAIANAGFILLGVLSGTPQGYAAAFFYVIIYSLTVIPAFGLFMLLSKNGFEPTSLDDFKGLNGRSPWYAGMMLLIMSSMAGLPPLVGFFAKFAVLQEALNNGFIIVSIIAVIFSVIGSYYYLRIIRLMYFDDAIDNSPIIVSNEMRVILSANILLLLILGIFPSGLISYCMRAINL